MFEHAVFDRKTKSYTPQDLLPVQDRRIFVLYREADGSTPPPPSHLADDQYCIVLPREPEKSLATLLEWKHRVNHNRRRVSGLLFELYKVRFDPSID